MFLRKCTCTRRRCRLWSTRSAARRRTTSSLGRPRRRRTATSARGSSGASPGKGCGAPSAASSATRSARTSSTRTACKVSSSLLSPLKAPQHTRSPRIVCIDTRRPSIVAAYTLRWEFSRWMLCWPSQTCYWVFPLCLAIDRLYKCTVYTLLVWTAS